MSLPRRTWWPLSLLSRTSAGTTPTAATYSSPMVSILVTWCSQQIVSRREKCWFRKLSNICGVMELACASKSAIMMNSTDTQLAFSAITTSGFCSKGPSTCSGSMYSKISKILWLASLCFMSLMKSLRCDLSRWCFLHMTSMVATQRTENLANVSRGLKNSLLYSLRPKMMNMAMNVIQSQISHMHLKSSMMRGENARRKNMPNKGEFASGEQSNMCLTRRGARSPSCEAMPSCISHTLSGTMYSRQSSANGSLETTTNQM
mmetsp:Transcript_73405/g.202613  ORF Transcript_73405/g.202613 Transcript_73405/m.202613 type:complete len:261 (+) Transcript_73405:2251-3033(+)